MVGASILAISLSRLPGASMLAMHTGLCGALPVEAVETTYYSTDITKYLVLVEIIITKVIYVHHCLRSQHVQSFMYPFPSNS